MKTIKQIADYHKVSETSIKTLKRKGVDIQDRYAVRDAYLSQQRRPQSYINGHAPWEDPPAGIEDDSEELPEDEAAIRDQALKATTWDEARFRWTQLKALKESRQLDILHERYVSAEDVAEDYTRIGFAVKAAMIRLSNDLPPMLEGMSAPQMKKKIREQTIHILAMLGGKDAELFPSDT